MVFCYRYGLLGGVSAQLLNRLPYLSPHFDVTMVYEQDHGMASRFPAGAAIVAPTPAERTAALRRLAPDITVVIDSPNFIDAWRAAGSPGRLVLEVHTTTANVSYLHNKQQFAEVAHIVTVSSYMERMLRGLEFDRIAPITIAPNCLQELWREPSKPLSLDGRPVIWVGKLDAHKRWRTAVDLMDQLSEEPELDLLPILIGGFTAPGPEVMAITTRLATSAGLANAAWWPRVEYDLMPRLYSAVTANGGVQLCTTNNESFGMAVAESLVRRCPVIAPAVGALPELLPEAALYQPDDWSEALEKTSRALADDKFRVELLETADHVRELTRPTRIVDAYKTVFASLLG
jgi:glycosyltransferase involved in cell wall biosynthesis